MVEKSEEQKKKEIEHKRKMVISYFEDEDLISDEIVEFIYKLIASHGWLTKTEMLELSGYDTTQTFDTAYPQPYADKIREIYPNFRNGWYFFDYSKQAFGELVNVYDLFAVKIQLLFGHGK